MRIVAGSHRGRRLFTPAGSETRPTADRTRETLFNILAHGLDAGVEGSPLSGARVLDAFCGSGALGLEALSRGAASCTFIDRSSAALAAVRDNIEALDETDRATVLRCDVLKPPPARQPVTLALLDPPYGEAMAVPALLALSRQGWLAPGALVVIEAGARDPLEPPEGFVTLDQRRNRLTTLHFLRVQAAPNRATALL